MCFVKDSGIEAAPRSVQVLKILKPNLESPVKNYPYVKDVLNPEVKLDVEKDYIFEGYHAYLNEKSLLNDYKQFGFKTLKEFKDKTPYIVGVCEIPKGSLYSSTAQGRVVSSNIILRSIYD